MLSQDKLNHYSVVIAWKGSSGEHSFGQQSKFTGQRCQAPRNGKICGAFISKFNPERDVPFCQPCISHIMHEEIFSKRCRDIKMVWKEFKKTLEAQAASEVAKSSNSTHTS